MFNFHFVYSDGNTYDVENVIKIIFSTPTGLTEVSGDDILSARIPLKTISLYTSDGNFTVSSDNLMVIDVQKQTN